MIFNLYKQKPRPKVTPLHGYLAIGNGEAQLFSPDHKEWFLRYPEGN